MVSAFTEEFFSQRLVINLLANLQSTLDRAAPDYDGHVHVQDQRPACLVVQQLTPIFRGLLLKCGPDAELLQVFRVNR